MGKDRQYLRVAALVGITGVVLLGSCSEEPEKQGQLCSIDDFALAFEEEAQLRNLPGAVGAFIRANGSSDSVAYGFSDVEANRPMAIDSRLMSGSTGKMLAAAVALGLVDEGVLGLDTPLSSWFADEPWFPRLPNANDITLRSLLNHSSGLYDHPFLEEFAVAIAEHLDDPDFVFSKQEIIEFVLDREPLFPVGSGHGYTDTGYYLVGMIIEQSLKAKTLRDVDPEDKSYYDVLQERILSPLGLNLTTRSDSRTHEGLAQGYINPENPILKNYRTTLNNGVFRIHPGNEWTGGGLVTNPKDMARWTRAMVAGELFSAEMLDEMFTSRSQVDPQIDYGLGVFIYKTPIGDAVGHGGWFPGYQSFVAHFVDANVTIAIQTNSGDPTPPIGQMAMNLAKGVIECGAGA